MLVFGIIMITFATAKAQVNLTNYFRDCQRTEESFDDCVKDGLNTLTAYFRTGLPDYKVAPFDPFFALQVPQARSGPFFNYRLLLRNVTESGWTSSQITKFTTDFNRNSIQFTQFFPDKRLNGLYEIEGSFFGRRVKNRGSWNMKLFDYVQTMTITRKPQRSADGQLIANPHIRVTVKLETCKDMELHIGHLAGGRTIVETMLDWIINRAWQPGFVVLKPIINDLVGTAFTEIFNKNFQNFPFDKVFPS